MSFQTLAAGFADPVFDSQAAFRSAMWAMARPGRPAPLATDLTPPAPLNREAAALVLALCDFETPLWLDDTLAGAPAVVDFLRFHTGAPLVADPAAARFAVIAQPADMPELSAFCGGTPEFPDASATLILQVERLTGEGLLLEGPGVKDTIGLGATPLPHHFTVKLAANRRLFPLGVDLLLAGAGAVVGLPRSVTVREG